MHGAGVGNLQGVLSFHTMSSGLASGPLVERLRVHTDGNIGIGVSAPAERLEVAGKVKATALQGDALVVGANHLVVNGGNVGIGVGAPAEKLEVAGKVKAAALQSDGLLVGVNQLVVSGGNVGIGVAAPTEKLEVVGKVKATDLHGGALVVGTNQLVVSSGSVGIGISTPENAEGWSRVLDVLGATTTKVSVRTTNIDARVCVHESGWWNGPPGMILGTKTNHPLSLSTNGNARVVIDQAGNVGISGNLGVGTATPRAKIQVAGGAIVPAAGDSESAGLLFPGTGTGEGGWVRYYSRINKLVTGVPAPQSVTLAAAHVAGTKPVLPLAVVGQTLEIGVANDPSDHIALMPSGGVGIGTNAPSEKLDVRGNVKIHGALTTDFLTLGSKWRLSGVGDAHGNDDWLRLFDRRGSDYWGGLAAGRLWSSSGQLSGCDARLKDRIEPLSRALDKVLRLTGVSFVDRDPAAAESKRLGVIAQQVEEVVPEVVKPGPEGMKGVEYPGLVALLIEAVKAQQGLLVEQRALIERLLVSVGTLEAARSPAA
jgi:hypothetical protein